MMCHTWVRRLSTSLPSSTEDWAGAKLDWAGAKLDWAGAKLDWAGAKLD